MGEYDKALLKCLEALSSMVALVAVLVDDGRMSEQEAGAFNRTYGKWNAAHQDLVRAMEQLGDGFADAAQCAEELRRASDDSTD